MDSVPVPAGLAAQVTAVFVVLATEAVNCCACETYSDAASGATVTGSGWLPLGKISMAFTLGPPITAWNRVVIVPLDIAVNCSSCASRWKPEEASRCDKYFQFCDGSSR